MENEVLERRRYLQKNLTELGAKISGSTEEGTLSGICTFNLKGGINAEKRLTEILKDRKIFCSLRYTSGVGGIRVSPHYYTKYDEINYLLECVEEFITHNEAG